MGCGGGTDTTTVQNSVPQWVEDAGKDAYGKAQTFYNSGYTPYAGERQAPLNATQTGAMSQISGYAPPNVTGQAIDLVNRGTAPMSTERTVDQNGRLGATSDYMNPYVDAALQPAIDQIMRGYQVQRKGIDSSAIGAHAFGDARNGIMNARLGADTSQAIGDTSSKFYKDAFDTVMAQRGSDLDRFNNVDAGNRAAALAGANALPGIATADQNNFMARMQALLGIGSIQQQQAQTALDIPYQAYQAQQQDAYDRLASLVSVIGGVPYSRTQTTTAPAQSDLGGLFGGLGSLLGGAIGG